MAGQSRSPQERLDQLLVARGLAPTRTRAQALVLAGRVFSDGTRLEKPGMRLSTGAPLHLLPGPRYVSRGGLKLVDALRRLGVSAAGRDALDVGASTGGFTQVLLEAGAGRIVALDVGKGQLDWNLRKDPRVQALEGINARYLEPSLLPFLPQLVVMDVSFISVEQVLPAVMACLLENGEVVVLVKPQFEVGRGKVGRGGIVRDPSLHRAVLRKIVSFVTAMQWPVAGIVRSPVKGAEGNVEFFLHLLSGGTSLAPEAQDQAIESAVGEAIP